MLCDCGCGCTTDYRGSFRKKYPNGWPNHDGWYMCVECGKKHHWGNGMLDIDHIIPKSAGGPNCLRNLQPMCRSENRSAQVRVHAAALEAAGSFCIPARRPCLAVGGHFRMEVKPQGCCLPCACANVLSRLWA